jgi:hypothetical protein
LSCQSQCQTTNSSCQSNCYQGFSVTTQTQYWSSCMQTCSTRLSVCSNYCVAGITQPTSSPTAMLPPSQQASVPRSQSVPTPPMPPQLPDSYQSQTPQLLSLPALLFSRRLDARL